jgi:hypothetical protein
MTDIDDLLRETLEAQAGTLTPNPGLAAGATRRARQIRHRRVAAAGATTAAVVGVTSVAAAHAVGQSRSGSSHPVSVRIAAPTGGQSSSTAPPHSAPGGQGSNPDPSPTPTFLAACPAGQAPEVTATGSGTDSGDIQPDADAQSVSQALMQSYLVGISNREPLNAYGVGIDAAGRQGVVWIRFQNQSLVEVIPSDNAKRWSSYDATLGPCQQLGN